MIPVSIGLRDKIRKVCRKEKRQYEAVLTDMLERYRGVQNDKV